MIPFLPSELGLSTPLTPKQCCVATAVILSYKQPTLNGGAGSFSTDYCAVKKIVLVGALEVLLKDNVSTNYVADCRQDTFPLPLILQRKFDIYRFHLYCQLPIVVIYTCMPTENRLSHSLEFHVFHFRNVYAALYCRQFKLKSVVCCYTSWIEMILISEESKTSQRGYVPGNSRNASK